MNRRPSLILAWIYPSTLCALSTYPDTQILQLQLASSSAMGLNSSTSVPRYNSSSRSTYSMLLWRIFSPPPPHIPRSPRFLSTFDFLTIQSDLL
ncbi:hypothetical protein B0H13DRAFT_634273 [Mycena leptocephala]|nr:hypothetical protein B0H13DRAFT_634273 [Mycena leptocephala]